MQGSSSVWCAIVLPLCGVDQCDFKPRGQFAVVHWEVQVQVQEKVSAAY